MSNPKAEGREILTIVDLLLYELDIPCNTEVSFIIAFLGLLNLNRKKAFKENESRYIIYYNKYKWFKSF